MKIFASGEMLLRNSSMMNDFSEVIHGLDCLNEAMSSPVGGRLRSVIARIDPGLDTIFQENFEKILADVDKETYIISISEHGKLKYGDNFYTEEQYNNIDDEELYGRLSMWRAYANKNGIAIVINPKVFYGASAINAFISPVLYADRSGFLERFDELITGFENNFDELLRFGGALFLYYLNNALRLAVQSTKHPAFREEREWRIIYSPGLLAAQGKLDDEQNMRIPKKNLVLNGIPQRTYAIPFKDYPDEGFIGATIPALIDRILIGASTDANQIAQVYIDELTRLCGEDATSKVHITGVPLRV